MAFPFDLTEYATADLEEAISYIAADSIAAALNVADNLENAFRFLADWPDAGHRRQDLTDSPDVRFWPTGRYLITYLPATSPLLIIAVFHGSRDVRSLLPRRLELL
jgi:toxin ParE1/3/4